MWLETILEIVKVTVPALIVFLTVYVTLRQYFSNEYKKQMLQYKQNQHNVALPIRLQAYERLTMLCERVSLPNLIMRIRRESMTANDLHIALMVAMQQEFDHNVSQQVYVSPDLWEIIKLARADALNTIAEAYRELEDPNELCARYSTLVLQKIEQKGGSFLDKALFAIKKEASLML